MSELESSALKEFKKTIRSIRSSSDYPRSITAVKKKMGLPDSTKEVEIEALLIHATREQFGESLDADMVLMALGLLKGFDNHRNRSENRSGKTLVTERRKMFLKMSSYVADRHNHNNERRVRYYKSYEELEAAGENAIKAVVSALGSDDGDDIDEVAKHLYSKKSIIDEYLNEAKKYLIYDKKGNIVDVKLQELKNIRQEPTDNMLQGTLNELDGQDSELNNAKNNLPLAKEREEVSSLSHSLAEDTLNEKDLTGNNIECDNKLDEVAIESIHEQKSESDNVKNAPPSTTGQEQESAKGETGIKPGDESSTELNRKDKDTKDFIIKCSVVALSIVAVIAAFTWAFIVIHNNNVSQKAILLAMENSKVNQKPYSIKFRNPDEWLPFGKSYYLKVDPKPSDGTLEGLRCESKNPDIIEILSEPELHIQAIKESEDSKECNVRIKAYMSYDKNIKDEMTVHVIKDGQNESTDEGELDDKTPGNSSQKVD